MLSVGLYRPSHNGKQLKGIKIYTAVDKHLEFRYIVLIGYSLLTIECNFSTIEQSYLKFQWLHRPIW